MDIKTKAIIDDYLNKVDSACLILLEGINLQENKSLRNKWDFFEYISKARKMEFVINGITYRLHGKGCFAFCDDLFLNWNFGYRSRWCGIDPWLLGMTLKQNNCNQKEYFDGELLKKACELAVKEGEMFEKGGLYYYTIAKKDTFIPQFSEDYDTLTIEYFDDKWSIPRSKIIDRFLRKSIWICNQIYLSKNSYMLKFLLEGRVIYSLPYDDINYPESAIKIMSDEIIKSLDS